MPYKRRTVSCSRCGALFTDRVPASGSVYCMACKFQRMMDNSRAFATGEAMTPEWWEKWQARCIGAIRAKGIKPRDFSDVLPESEH